MKCPTCNSELTETRDDTYYASGGFLISNIVLRDIRVLRCPVCPDYEISIPHITELHRKLRAVAGKVKGDKSTVKAEFVGDRWSVIVVPRYDIWYNTPRSLPLMDRKEKWL
jgi:hypothetical protein